MLLLLSTGFSYIQYFSITIRRSNGLDAGQDGQNVHPDLGPDCFQWLSADDKSPLEYGWASAELPRNYVYLNLFLCHIHDLSR